MRLPLLAAAALLASIPSLAHADDLFTLTDAANTYTFQLPASPTPTATQNGSDFVLNSVAVTINGNASQHAVAFYGLTDGGGLTIGNEDAGFSDAGILVNTGGDVLFSGPASTPTFTLGTYVLTTAGPSSDEGPFTLSIQTAPSPTAVTPEPSSFFLLGTGLLGALGAARKRFA